MEQNHTSIGGNNCGVQGTNRIYTQNTTIKYTEQKIRDHRTKHDCKENYTKRNKIWYPRNESCLHEEQEYGQNRTKN